MIQSKKKGRIIPAFLEKKNNRLIRILSSDSNLDFIVVGAVTYLIVTY